MNKRERERVAEILRCVADSKGDVVQDVVRFTNASDHIEQLVLAARDDVRQEMMERGLYEWDGNESYDLSCLEAALRVEQGEWP